MTEPTGRSIRFANTRSSTTSASGPATSNFANGVMSNNPAASRVARCSAPTTGDHCSAAHPDRRAHSCVTPATSGRFASNHCGRSHPAPVKNTAPCATCRR